MEKLQVINHALIQNAMSFEQYFELSQKLVDEGRTTGDNQSESMIEFTRLNLSRLKKWIKTGQISSQLEETIAKVNKPVTWLMLVEPWCGDVAQNLAFIYKAASLNTNIQLKLILRDENLDIMDQYLTNGGRSIPKMVAFDSDLNELAIWGPRPASVQRMLDEGKASGDFDYQVFAISAHSWYAQNKGKELNDELVDFVKQSIK
ncbi:thioredoxin family protein [Marinigracilibium pacificum]|uniref:Thioredoxin family protein n=1 Tax=Marinigracilibium pacificum TaxID=2729599 RepID=A0A848J6Z3_9BACT|nr:thioredoxin family protein [Marinigracilibium pacificum]NMM50280.1 thioredoxin family protein [Marinigracilibium pacificum]